MQPLIFEYLGIEFTIPTHATYLQICGDSGTGKSFLFSALRDAANLGRLTQFNNNRVAVFDSNNIITLPATAASTQRWIICIDSGDLFLGRETLILQACRDNPRHIYLIAARGAIDLPFNYGAMRKIGWNPDKKQMWLKDALLP